MILWKNGIISWQSSENSHTNGAHTIITRQENVQKVHDLVLEGKWVTIKQIVEDKGVLYHVVCNIFIVELDIRKIINRCQKEILTVLCNRLLTPYKQINLKCITVDETKILGRKRCSQQWCDLYRDSMVCRCWRILFSLEHWREKCFNLKRGYVENGGKILAILLH